MVFSRVPAPIQSDYSLRIISIDDKELPTPVLLRDAYGKYLSSHTAMSHYNYAVRGLALSLLDQKLGDARRYRNILETSFINNSAVYEIVGIEYDTLDYWRTGRISKINVIQRFKSGQDL